MERYPDIQFPPDGAENFLVESLLAAERFDPKALEAMSPLFTNPHLLPAGKGHAVVFRFGVVVFFQVEGNEQRRFIERLRPAMTAPLPAPRQERLDATVASDEPEGLRMGTLMVNSMTAPKMLMIADVLAKSVMLDHYERQASDSFDQIEGFARKFKSGKPREKTKPLLQFASDALLSEHQLVGRVDIAGKPEVLWDHPDLERLFQRLEEEFDILDRNAVLERKIELISRTVNTALGLIHNRRSLRVEWYIVILIVLEIFLSLYSMFALGNH